MPPSRRGRTGSLKTSFTQALMAIWGADFLDDTRLLKFGEGMTRNAARGVAAAATHMPIFFDNFKPNTGGGHDWLVNLIHSIVEGGDKLRMDPNAQLKDRKDIRAWPLSTGEDVPNTDPATLARQLIVEFSWKGGRENEKLAHAQEAGRHLSAIGRVWLQWLEEPTTKKTVQKIGAEYSKRRKAWNRFLWEERRDMVNPARVADNLATNAIVADIAMQCGALRPVLEPRLAAYQEGLQEIGREMGDYTSESLEGWRFIQALRALWAGGRITMTKRRGEFEVGDERRHIGWFDGDGYYLIPELAVSAVEELEGKGALSHVTKRTLYEQLKDMGYVAKTGHNSTTRKVRVGVDGKRRRVLHLTREALDERAEGKGDDGADETEPF